MKKIILFVLAAAMCFALAACGNRTAAESGNTTSGNTASSNTENTEILSEPQVSDSMNANADPVIEYQPMDLAGPWHLDKEKTDISAIEAAWETFPGYGEWGASMEIRSNGQMSWYIGAVGGSGTYTMEGNVLHAKLTDSVEQKESFMDFRIVGNNTIKMTYADTDIIWAYGDQEDTAK